MAGMDSGKKMKKIPKMRLAMAMPLVFCGATDPGMLDDGDGSPTRGGFAGEACWPQAAQSVAPSGISWPQRAQNMPVTP